MEIENRVIACEQKRVLLNMILMEKSCYIWFAPTGSQNHKLDTLFTAIKTNYEAMPMSRVLLSDHETDDERGISRRISHKFGIQTFLSYNSLSFVENDLIILEKHISDILSLRYRK